MDPAIRTRLDSWKAIADYLGRNTRTVTRWAKDRGMPVHRVPGGKRNAVFAYSSEIDAWLTSRNEEMPVDLHPNGLLEDSDQPALLGNVVANIPDPTDPNRTSQSLFEKAKWALLAAAVCTIGIVWAIENWVSRSHASASVRPGGFMQLTDDGRIKRNLRTDGTTLYFNESLGLREVLMSTTTRGGPIHIIPTSFPNVNLQDVSHSGQSLLITSFEGIESEQPLWVIPAQGGTAQRIGNITCHSARWSPDDHEIACAAQDKILLVDVDGTNARFLGLFHLHQ